MVLNQSTVFQTLICSFLVNMFPLREESVCDSAGCRRSQKPEIRSSYSLREAASSFSFFL